jgi:ABC-type lipoprotein release transport system permease subunit
MKKGYLLRLGTKNLSRYKKRTFITMLVLAVGIACYIMIDSLLLGTMKESENNLIRYEMGQGRLVTPTYWEEWKDRPLDSGIPAPDKIINQLKTEGISAVKRIEFISQAIVHTGIGGSFPVVVTAVDMERDLEVLDTLDKLSEGRLPHSEEDGVVIGQWMAQDLAIGLGDQITIPIIDRWGSRDAMALEVTGLLNTPNPEINKGGFFIPLEGADYYLDMEGMVSYIAVDFPQIGSEKRKALALLKELAQREGLEYHKWEDWSADYLAVASGDVYSSGFILFLIFIIAFVGLGNTMLMSVMERQREIGMMRSLGARDREILFLILSESLIIGVMGSLLGMVLAALGNIPLVLFGIDFSFLMREMSVGYRITGIIYGVWSVKSYVYGFLAGSMICVMVAWLTVRKIMKKSITDEIRAA